MAAPNPFPIPGMVLVGVQSPSGDDHVMEYHIKKALGARLGMKRSELSDDLLAIPEPLSKMLANGAIAPPDGTPEDDSPEPYVKTENGMTEALELFQSKKFDTIAKLTITNNTPMKLAEFISRASTRVVVIAKCFQIWAALHGEPPTTPFIFLGHGGEVEMPFENRASLGEGYTLITFTECGLQTYVDKISNFLEWAKVNQDKAMNPEKHEKELGEVFKTSIHVYKANDKYPALTYYPMLSHERATRVRTSGLHLLPLIAENTMNKPMEIESSKPMDLSRVLSIYNGALYPSIDMVLNKKPIEFEQFYVRIEDIFEKFGPGVYYWPICRARDPREARLRGVTAEESAQWLPLRRSMSNEQQDTRRAAAGEGKALGGRKRRKTARKTRRRRY